MNDGYGFVSTESELIQRKPYGAVAQAGNLAKTSPGELLAAAHAASFSMSLAHELESSQLAPVAIATLASVRIDEIEGRRRIGEIDLYLKASLHGSAAIPFLVAATRAKAQSLLSESMITRVNLHTEILDQRPGSETTAEVVIFTSTYCQVCGQAKTMLESQGIHYREIDLDQEPPEIAEELRRKTNRLSVPQIFAGDHFIGNYDDLIRLDADHGLQNLLRSGAESKTDLNGFIPQSSLSPAAGVAKI